MELENTHLEDHPAGSWLRIFELNYSPNAERLKKQITNTLHMDASLIDEYISKDNSNNVKTYVWEYRGHRILEQYYKGGVWEGPKIVPFQEYYRGGWNSWITIMFPEGRPYSELLPEHYQKISQDREYEHAATIESAIDQHRRLFLFGYGRRCDRISLY